MKVLNTVDFIYRRLHSQSNVEEITSLLISELGIKTAYTTTSKLLLSHPYFPSMTAIADMLNCYNVDCVALKTTDETIFNSTDGCLLAQIRSGTSNTLFSLIYKCESTSLDWYNPITHRRESISRKQFLKLYTGYVMLFDSSRKKDEKNYDDVIKDEFIRFSISNILFFILPVVSLSVLFLQNTFSLHNIVLIVLINLGYIIGSLLILYEFNEYSPILSKVCGINKKISCNSVLHSRASRLIGIPWSVIGTSYYAGLLMYIVITNLNIQSLALIAILHFAALPYAIFSIYHQWYVIKKWCPFCLAVQVISFLLFAHFLITGIYDSIGISPFNIMAMALSMSTSFIALYLLWKYANETKTQRFFKYSLMQFKHDPDVFTTLLLKSEEIPYFPDDSIGIILGNPKGKIHIVKVCNPYCIHCAEAQTVLDKLIKNNEDIKLQIIFAISPDSHNYKNSPVDLFLSLYYEGERMEAILSEWYSLSTKDLNAFEKKYHTKDRFTITNYQNAKKMDYFCNKIGITGTPTVFVNNHKLPRKYIIEDLQYCIS